jgi:hypothetical protein
MTTTNLFYKNTYEILLPLQSRHYRRTPLLQFLRPENIKLCPRLHVNPRNAEACSRCGSRELSTPQPKVPFWATILLFSLSLVPGLILAIFSIAAIAFFVRHLLNTPDMLLALAILQILLGTLWWGWTQIPLFFRKTIHKMLQRRRNGEQRD